MTAIERYIVGKNPGHQRLSEYARAKFQSLPTRKSVKKAIKRGMLLVNGEPANTGHWVQPGEELSVVELPSENRIYKYKLEVIFQDEHYAVINKPGDMVVSGNRHRSAVNALPFNLQPGVQKDALSRPQPVHRLDRQTSGVLLVAKTRTALANLGVQFEKRTVKKTYAAIVQGILNKKGSIDESLNGKNAKTSYSPMRRIENERFGWLTMLEMNPHTGRHNQIRRHLELLGYPILGDIRFGGTRSGKGLFLFAHKIEFNHPQTGEWMSIKAPLPGKFDRYMNPG